MRKQTEACVPNGDEQDEVTQSSTGEIVPAPRKKLKGDYLNIWWVPRDVSIRHGSLKLKPSYRLILKALTITVNDACDLF